MWSPGVVVAGGAVEDGGRPSMDWSSVPSAASTLRSCSDLARRERLWRNQRTPVLRAPTMKEAREMAMATSTGTSTRVLLEGLGE